MKIVFCELETAYELLDNLDAENEEDSDNSGSVLGLPSQKIITDFCCSPVPLPFPLRKGSLYFFRKKDNYEVSFGVISEDPVIFEGSSALIIDAVKEKMGLEYSVMGGEGIGYVLGEDKVPFLSIGETQLKEQRIFYLGTGGAKTQQFSNPESFRENVRKLEALVNIGVDAWLKPLADEGLTEIPSHYIYVSI